MACDRFTRELNDHALGAPLEPRAAAHLAVCAACQARFARETRLMAAIDTAIEEVGSTRPAADYPPRLRESIAVPIESRRGSWHLAAGAVAAAALLVVVVRLGWSRQGADHVSDSRTAVEVIKDRAPSRIGGESAHRVATAGQSIPSRSAQSRVRPTSRRGEPDVLVPAGQPEIIARLLASLHAQEPDVASQLVGRSVVRAGRTQPAEAPVSLAPILIEAVNVPELSALEPVRANGGVQP
jgi:hypothetical protein